MYVLPKCFFIPFEYHVDSEPGFCSSGVGIKIMKETVVFMWELTYYMHTTT